MKYFGYYAEKKRQSNANCTLAAINKMYYIATRISRIDGKCEIISAVSPLHGKQEAQVSNLDSNISVRYFKASTYPNKVLKVVKLFLNNFRMFVWAFNNINAGEPILVYHSLGYMNTIRILKWLKKFSLILEVEEIYADVLQNSKLKARELQYMQLADAYVFPTQLLSDAVNMSKKPEVIIHGVYEGECSDAGNVCEKSSSERHILYAGTFDPRKGGVYAAINATKYLPVNYHMHILGFGTEGEVQQIKKMIRDINGNSCATISYDGLKSGRDYIEFLKRCDVGVSTQNPHADFNDTSFPSKILSYLANGLGVVSAKIPVVMTSKVADLIFYYHEQQPEEIAAAIVKACESSVKKDVKERIKKLDEEFCVNLVALVNEVKRRGENNEIMES